MIKLLEKIISFFKPRRGEVTISARVYRAKTGKWEDLGVISRGKVDLRTNVS